MEDQAESEAEAEGPALARPIGTGRKVLFSAMKNEAPFLLEWVAYHKAIGFDEIVICSNPSNDGTEELLAALAKAGEIRHLRATVPLGASPQYLATQAFEREVGFRDGDWYMWLDADEFLNVHVGDRTVTALVDAMGDKQIALINWRIFGSSGWKTFPGRFVSDAFTGAAEEKFRFNNALKSFFRFGPALSGFARHGIHRPRVVQNSGLGPEDVLVGTGKTSLPDHKTHRRWLAGDDFVRTSTVSPFECGWALAQINHYMVRTEDHFALKALRGRGYKPRLKVEANTRHTPKFFAEHDRNEAEDRSILYWDNAVTAGIARLMALPTVADADHAARALVREALAQSAAASEPATPETAVVAAVRPRRVLFSAMKNEAPFLLEWVAYHKAIGFDQIVICSNPSSDGTEELLAALAEAGEITHLRAVIAAGQSPQRVASAVFANQVGYNDGDWYLWLDADEFLNIHVGDRTVDALIHHMDGKQCALINWRVFGSSGQDSFGGRFIDPTFSRASQADFLPNLELKSFFRHSAATRGFARYGINRPLIARKSALRLNDVLVGNGATASDAVPMHHRWLKGVDSGGTGRVPVGEFGWVPAQINHYIVRTRDLFALKRLRGRGYKPDAVGAANLRHTAAFFEQHDRNEAEDISILYWDTAVTAGIARMMAVPAVADADRVARALVREALSVSAIASEAIAPETAAAVAARPQYVLVSAVKNEAPFLLEWIAYHKKIGFTRIVLISNESNDGTEDLLAALADAGEIVHYKAKPRRRQSPQMAALALFEKMEGYQEGNWYLWLDADEFLNIHVGGRRVEDLTAALGDHEGIHLNWRVFGTSGHQNFPGRFVSEDFPGSAGLGLDANRETKSLFRKGPAIIGFGSNGICRPRLAEGHGLEADSFLAGNGKPLSAVGEVTRKWLAGDKVRRSNISTASEAGWVLAQINHYAVRTPEYFQLKVLRGRGAAKLPLKGNSRHTPEFFRKFNMNGVRDLSIADWKDEVGDEITRLGHYAPVAAAIAKSDVLMQEILSGVVLAEAGDVQPMSSVEATSEPIAIDAVPSPEVVFKLTFPRGVAGFVRQHYTAGRTILEYGSGGSTILAAEVGCTVTSVESDKDWAVRLSAALSEISAKATVHHVNIGATRDWGRPLDAKGYAKYHRYALSVWDQPDFQDPDLVLIDGRFRAACLAAVKMRATRPTTVLFDDYVDRRYYHGVENLAVKEEVIGRMARFTVTPGPVPPEMLTQVIGWFSDPR